MSRETVHGQGMPFPLNHSQYQDFHVDPGVALGQKVIHVFPSSDHRMFKSAWMSAGTGAGRRTTSLATAITWAVTGGGDIIVLHAGTFTQNTTITIAKSDITIIDAGWFYRQWFGAAPPQSRAQINYTPATAVSLFDVGAARVQFIGLDVRASGATAAAKVFDFADGAADKCSVIGGQIVVTDATTLVVGVDSDGDDTVVHKLRFLANVAGNVAHVGVRVSAPRPIIQGCEFATPSNSATCYGVHLDSGALCGGVVFKNTFNFTAGGTGVLIAASTTFNRVQDNMFATGSLTNITNSGGATNLLSPNYEDVLADPSVSASNLVTAVRA